MGACNNQELHHFCANLCVGTKQGTRCDWGEPFWGCRHRPATEDWTWSKGKWVYQWANMPAQMK